MLSLYSFKLKLQGYEKEISYAVLYSYQQLALSNLETVEKLF